MNPERMIEILRAKEIVGSCLEKEIKMVCACDLMSDVLSCIQIGSTTLLLTNLTHPQTVRTAEMAEISVICFTRGKKLEIPTIKLAEENDIVLLSTPFSLYEASGRLYKEGIPGCSQ